MVFSIRRGLEFALLVTAAASLAACASHPKLAGPGPTGPSGPPESGYAPPPPQGPVTEGEESGPVRPGSARDFVINAGDLVYFDFDSFNLRDDARPVLDAQAQWLGRYRDVRVRIEGNCDERGTREYNFALGARRANAVREYLEGHGISASRIDTISYGKERPIDPGDSEEALARNRNGHTVVIEGAR
jgi:peptidoglycan-associated lipoprotein